MSTLPNQTQETLAPFEKEGIGNIDMKACPLCQAKRSVFERELNHFTLLKCDSCSFVYADIADERIMRANSNYDAKASTFYDLQQTYLDDLWFLQIARRFTKKLGSGRVLDVGCGNGRLLRHFRRLHWECWGIDTSPWSKGFAEQHGFTLRQGTIEDLAPGMDPFDLVVSSSTLEHIAQPLLHAKSIARVLKEKGCAYFCGIPNYASLSVRLGFSSFSCNTPPEHVSYFTPKTVKRLFASADIPFHQITIRTYGLPEIHRVYRALISFSNTSACSPEKRPAKISPHQEKPTSSTFTSKVRRFCYQIGLGAFYNFGRIGSLGDKLEILIRK